MTVKILNLDKGPHAGFSRRAANNAPIQEIAARDGKDTGCHRRVARNDTVVAHDELLIELAKNAVNQTIECGARDVMEGAANRAVKLDIKPVTDVGQGANWAKAH